MTTALAQPERAPDAALIRRVNQLYHELTHEAFDRQHRDRHRVEAPFWRTVARTVLGDASPASARAAVTGASGHGVSAGRVVVDLACGTGFVTRILADSLGPDDRLVALDLSPAALRTTARKCAPCTGHCSGPSLECFVSDAARLPLPDASVDLLAINAALHHLPGPLATLAAIDRVLKPGGFFALGFEPNRAHFDSPALRGLSRGLDRLAWYASPRQNRRRIARWIARRADEAERHERPDVLAAALNDQLLRDGLLSEPADAGRLLDWVDPHARGAKTETGFRPISLLREALPDYVVHRLSSSDFLGESPRRWPPARSIIDAVMSRLLAERGSLFSWLVQKPPRPAHSGDTPSTCS